MYVSLVSNLEPFTMIKILRCGSVFNGSGSFFNTFGLNTKVFSVEKWPTGQFSTRAKIYSLTYTGIFDIHDWDPHYWFCFVNMFHNCKISAKLPHCLYVKCVRILTKLDWYMYVAMRLKPTWKIKRMRRLMTKKDPDKERRTPTGHGDRSGQ